MTGSEIYRSFFGLDRLTPNPHGETMRKYLVLANDPDRSSADWSVPDEGERERERGQVAVAGDALPPATLPQFVMFTSVPMILFRRARISGLMGASRLASMMSHAPHTSRASPSAVW